MEKESKPQTQSFWQTVENLFIFILSSLFSHTKPLIAHVFFVLIGLFILYAINDIFSFTDDYRTNDKIDQIAKIETILKQHNVDSTTYQKIKLMEYQVIDKKPHLFRLYQLLDNVFVTIPSKIEIDNKKRNWLIHFFSSGYFTILGIPFIPFFTYKISDNKKFIHVFKKAVLAILLALTFVLTLSAVNYIIFPTFDNIVYNYLLNATSSTLILLMLILFAFFDRLDKDGELDKLHA